MKLNKTTLAAALALCYGTALPVAHATAAPGALSTGEILTITNGVATGTTAYGKLTGSTGSWFAMGGTTAPANRTLLSQGVQGLMIGITQTPGGLCTNGICTYTGAPKTNDSANINAPWLFYGNTGKNYTRTAVTGGTSTGLNMSGWTVTWNAIPTIPMNSAAWAPSVGKYAGSYSNGVGNFTWDGVLGDAYSVNYTATVPSGYGSGFGGVKYFLHLEGVVHAAPTPVVTTGGSAVALNPTAPYGGNAGNAYLVTPGATTGSGLPLPAFAEYSFSGGVFDYTANVTSGATVNVVQPLLTPIPSNAAGYYEYYGALGKWQLATNVQSGTMNPDGTCPSYATDPGAYSVGSLNGLTAGDQCVLIPITDSGANDTDATAGVIGDPGGVAIQTGTLPSTVIASAGHSGCSIDPNPAGPESVADWWLVAGFIGWLGIRGRKTRAK